MTATAKEKHFDGASCCHDNGMSAQTIEVFFLGRTIPPIGVAFILVETTALGALVMADGEWATVHQEGVGGILLFQKRQITRRQSGSKLSISMQHSPAHDTPSLRITLFGSLTIRLGDQTPAELPPQQSAVLLAYLALNLSQAHPREYLAALLW